MYVITKEVQFDAGHRVPDHKSKCRNPHGHRYRVVARVEARELVTEGSSKGMVADFGDIKQLLTQRVHDLYDHGFIVYEGDIQMMHLFFPRNVNDHAWNIHVVPFVPTAENLAASIFEDLHELIAELGGCRLIGIDVWETPTSCASYWR